MAGTGIFHEGEIAVQNRAGTRAAAEKLGPRVVQSRLDAELASFLSRQPFVIVASTVPSGHVWASVLSGRPGFAAAIAGDHIVVRASIAATDPLAEALEGGPAPVGLLVIEPVARSRIRINGTGTRTAQGLEVDLTEVFGNCPKYIQRRVPTARVEREEGTVGRVGTHLDAGEIALVRSADTFFIASRHPDRGADASHRGGRPGFVNVDEAGGVLTFPDYQGNSMFQTLGNLTVNPQAGVLFIDWNTGRTLQIAGHADVIWEDQRLVTWPGALRLIDLRIKAVINRAQGFAVRWKFVEAHQLNPPVPR